MFKIHGCNYENHTKEDDCVLTFLPSEGSEHITNSFGIVCDKIIIYKDAAIVFYLYEKVIKFVDAVNCTINYEYQAFKNQVNVDHYKIIYSNEIGYDKDVNDEKVMKEKNRVGEMINKELYIKYPSFDTRRRYIEREGRTYDIGDSVLPLNIPININGEMKYYYSIYNDILVNNTHRELTDGEKERLLLNIITSNAGIIVDIIKCEFETIYVIEVNGKKVCATSREVSDYYEELRQISKCIRWVIGEY